MKPRVPKMKQFNLTPLISLVGRKNKRLRKYINGSYIKIFVSYLAFSCALCHILKSRKRIFQHLARFDTFFKELYVTGYMDYKLPYEQY